MKLTGRDKLEGHLVDQTVAFALAEGPALNIQAAAISTITAAQAMETVSLRE